MLVGIASAWLTHQTSTNQMAAESDRVALEFSREQRKIAYADHLNAIADLYRAEYNIKYQPSPIGPVEAEQLEDRFKIYSEAGDKFNRTGATVRLLASQEVVRAREAIRDKHNRINDQIEDLMLAIRRGSESSTLNELRLKLDLDYSPYLEQQFINAAKKDLGLSD